MPCHTEPSVLIIAITLYVSRYVLAKFEKISANYYLGCLSRSDAHVKDAAVEAAVHGQVVRQQAEVVVLVAADEEQGGRDVEVRPRPR